MRFDVLLVTGVTLLGALWLFRFDIAATDEYVYKLDRWTGTVQWYVGDMWVQTRGPAVVGITGLKLLESD